MNDKWIDIERLLLEKSGSIKGTDTSENKYGSIRELWSYFYRGHDQDSRSGQELPMFYDQVSRTLYLDGVDN